jgi:transposase
VAEQDGATIPETAEWFGVSIISVVRFRTLHREMGSISPAKFDEYKGYALAAHEDLVRQLVAEQPDITLAEIKAVLATEKVTVSQSSISRVLHHLNLRFKESLRAAEQDRSDVAAARKALQKQQTRLDPKRLVFIDETSVSTTITRLYGCRNSDSCLECDCYSSRNRSHSRSDLIFHEQSKRLTSQSVKSCFVNRRPNNCSKQPIQSPPISPYSSAGIFQRSMTLCQISSRSM